LVTVYLTVTSPPMSVLIIKNVVSEGPGTITEFLKGNEIPFRIVEAGLGEPIPSLDNFSYVVIMGGPMAVYEMEQYPFLKDVGSTIEKAFKMNKKVLGICLGAQLMAHVLGARVYQGDKKEIGWLPIEPTIDGARDEVFRQAIESTAHTMVLQWHGDTFDIPSGGVRLASSRDYPNQAFRYNNSYGLQFHIEVTPDIIKEWFQDREDFHEILKDTERLYPRYRLRADLFYRAFFR
jgi:GMP synthase (glutamine-hydrolysing)